MNSALPPGTQDTHTCPCGQGDEPCPGPDGMPLCASLVDQVKDCIAHYPPSASKRLLTIIEKQLRDDKALIEQLHAKTTCCCGDAADHSAMGAGHSPVSMYDYALMNAEHRIGLLEEAINLFLQKRMSIFTDSRAVDDDLVALAGVTANDGVDVSMKYLRDHADDVVKPLDVQVTQP